MRLSIVIPVYNGGSTIGPLVNRLVELLSLYSLQIVLVNDGSYDNSDEVCRALQEKYSDEVLYLRLARNFGEHNAVMAGLNHAEGDYVVIMDDDFQNPPAEVPRLVDYAGTHDCDVVYTYSPTSSHHWFRILGSRFNDRVAASLLKKPRGLYLSSFKCLRRFTVKEIIKYQGPYPYIDGLILRSTRNIGAIEVRHDPRRDGHSNYTLRKLIALWLNMAVNFSVMPLRVSTVLGLGCSAAGFALAILVIVERLFLPKLPMPLGWASGMVVVLLLSGTQLAMLGLVGEYVGRLFLMGNQTPQFVVRDIYCKGQRCASDLTPITSVANRC